MMLTPLFFVQYALEQENRDWKSKEENAKDEVKEGLKTSYTISNGGASNLEVGPIQDTSALRS